MQTILIDDKWIETIQLFGDTESVIREALKLYSVEQCRQRIRKADFQLSAYNKKYNCNYDYFKHAVQTDKKFLSKIEAQNPLWEEDAMEWEYWSEEYQEWKKRLENILKH